MCFLAIVMDATLLLVLFADLRPPTAANKEQWLTD